MLCGNFMLELVGNEIQILGRQVIVLGLRIQLRIGTPLEEIFVRVLVFEVLAKVLPLVGTPDLGAHDSPLFVGELRHFSVHPAALLEELGPLFHPIKAVCHQVPGGRDVVGQVPALELPDLHEVRLQHDDRVDVGPQLGPVLDFFVVVGVEPDQVGGNAAEAQEHEVHRRARGIDLSQLVFAQIVASSQLGRAVPPGPRPRRAVPAR